MKYEEITQTHVPLLAPLYVEAFNAPPWNDSWTVKTASRRLRQMLHCEGAYGLACFDGDAPVGMILGEPDLFYDCDQMYIKEFCVALDRRGGGIGSALLSEYERRLHARGIAKVYLLTSRGDGTESFYQRRGYASWNGMVMMGKPLD